jgi:hypothetical protein
MIKSQTNSNDRFANPSDESYFSEESRPQVGILLKKMPTLIGSFTLKFLMDIHPRAQWGDILAFSR